MHRMVRLAASCFSFARSTDTNRQSWRQYQDIAVSYRPGPVYAGIARDVQVDGFFFLERVRLETQRRRVGCSWQRLRSIGESPWNLERSSRSDSRTVSFVSMPNMPHAKSGFWEFVSSPMCRQPVQVEEIDINHVSGWTSVCFRVHIEEV